MSFVPTPTQFDVQAVLRSFLLSILPAGTEVVEGQANNVPEVKSTEFVLMTIIRQVRISTNIDDYSDVAFTASIVGNVMTVTAMELGRIIAGASLTGVGVTIPTTIIGFITGFGNLGTYFVSPAQIVSSRLMSCGAKLITQPTEVVVQLDVHSAELKKASDMAQAITTLLRDDFATIFFKSSGITPLTASDPKQMPFFNEAQQTESRYVIEAALQANQLVTPPQQFAEKLRVTLISVENGIPLGNFIVTQNGDQFITQLGENIVWI